MKLWVIVCKSGGMEMIDWWFLAGLGLLGAFGFLCGWMCGTAKKETDGH